MPTLLRALRRRVAVLVAVFAVLLPLAFAQAQTPAIEYVYDDLNRLVGVVDQQGNAATYTYDAVGNILRIDRFATAPQPPAGITAGTAGGGGFGGALRFPRVATRSSWVSHPAPDFLARSVTRPATSWIGLDSDTQPPQ